MQPKCVTCTVTQMQGSVARNMLILASSSWNTLVSMANLVEYQYLQANSQGKEILQLYMTTCLYRLKAIKSLLSWASLSSDHCNDFLTVFRKLVEAMFLHLQDTPPFLHCKLLRFSASPWQHLSTMLRSRMHHRAYESSAHGIKRVEQKTQCSAAKTFNN